MTEYELQEMKQLVLNAFDVLGIDINASPAEIKKAYRDLIKKHHPDKYTDKLSKEEAEKRTREINTAKEFIDYYCKNKDAIEQFIRESQVSQSNNTQFKDNVSEANNDWEELRTAADDIAKDIREITDSLIAIIQANAEYRNRRWKKMFPIYLILLAITDMLVIYRADSTIVNIMFIVTIAFGMTFTTDQPKPARYYIGFLYMLPLFLSFYFLR